MEQITPSLPAKKKIPNVKVGSISKEGHFVASWKARHFVLLSTENSSKLTYYVRATKSLPFGEDEKGSLNLKGTCVTRQGALVVLKGANNYELKLKFDNEDDKDAWVIALREHIAYASKL